MQVIGKNKEMFLSDLQIVGVLGFEKRNGDSRISQF